MSMDMVRRTDPGARGMTVGSGARGVTGVREVTGLTLPFLPRSPTPASGSIRAVGKPGTARITRNERHDSWHEGWRSSGPRCPTWAGSITNRPSNCTTRPPPGPWPTPASTAARWTASCPTARGRSPPSSWPSTWAWPRTSTTSTPPEWVARHGRCSWSARRGRHRPGSDRHRGAQSYGSTSRADLKRRSADRQPVLRQQGPHPVRPPPSATPSIAKHAMSARPPHGTSSAPPWSSWPRSRSATATTPASTPTPTTASPSPSTTSSPPR